MPYYGFWSHQHRFCYKFKDQISCHALTKNQIEGYIRNPRCPLINPLLTWNKFLRIYISFVLQHAYRNEPPLKSHPCHIWDLATQISWKFLSLILIWNITFANFAKGYYYTILFAIHNFEVKSYKSHGTISIFYNNWHGHCATCVEWHFRRKNLYPFGIKLGILALNT